MRGPVAQLGERYNRTVEVRSSSLLRSTTKKLLHKSVEEFFVSLPQQALSLRNHTADMGHFRPANGMLCAGLDFNMDRSTQRL